jgi:hypothetical protein
MDPHRGQIEVSLATPADRPEIYAIRHQVYARTGTAKTPRASVVIR